MEKSKVVKIVSGDNSPLIDETKLQSYINTIGPEKYLSFVIVSSDIGVKTLGFGSVLNGVEQDIKDYIAFYDEYISLSDSKLLKTYSTEYINSNLDLKQNKLLKTYGTVSGIGYKTIYTGNWTKLVGWSVWRQRNDGQWFLSGDSKDAYQTLLNGDKLQIYSVSVSGWLDNYRYVVYYEA